MIQKILLYNLLLILVISDMHAQSDPLEIFNGRNIFLLKKAPSKIAIGNNSFFIKAITVGHDNDLFGFAASNLNNDESYTGGFQLQFTTSPILEKVFLRYAKPTDFERAKIHVNNLSKIELGALAYTPFDIETSEIVEEDRPYGSFHYIGLGLNSTILKELAKKGRKGKSKIIHKTIESEIYVGIIGGYSSSIFQSWVHRFMTRESPNGWQNQTNGNKRTLAINYRLSNRFLLWQPSEFPTRTIIKNNEVVVRTIIPVSTHIVTELNLGSYISNLGAGFRFQFLEINRGARFVLKNSLKDQSNSAVCIEDCIRVYNPELDLINEIKAPKLAENWSFYLYASGNFIQ